ncbi:MAG: hypothetical protein HY616_09555 [Candidatus Rokubacteria bacterium]|nr:hypothetical protein [Candidatus Rokubacteria bacterium]
MDTIATVLARSLAGRGGDLTLTLDPAFQGLPDTAHGGSVLAVFDALAGLPAPRALGGVYRTRVPLGVPLGLAHTHAGTAHVVTLRDADGAVLVDGRVAKAAADAEADGGRGPRRDPLLLPPAGLHPLPVSRACFACGTDNPRGLRVQLAFDDAAVRGTWQPREPFRAPDGTLTTAALTTLLDEAAFWLGALATGESGMTTDLAVTLHRPAPFGAPVTVAGARAGVRPRPGDARYWDTEVVAEAGGAPVASARITFVAVRGAARRLTTGMLSVNDPAVVRRVFPAYAR